jgi:hypothetical protein
MCKRLLSLKKVTLLFLLIVTTLFACRKQSSDETTPTPPPTPPTTGTAQKMIVDTTDSKLLSTSSELDAGIFRYNKLPGVEKLKKGDFLIETRNYGYLRIIEDVTTTSGEVKLSTTQGTIEQFYKDSGDVRMTFKIPESESPLGRKGKINDGTAAGSETLKLGVSGFTISGDGYSLKVENMSFGFDASPTFDFNILEKRVKVGFENVRTEWQLSTTATIELNNREIADTFRLSKIVPNLSKILKLQRAASPLTGSLTLKDVYLEIKAKGKSKLEVLYNYEEINNTVAYIEYANGQKKAVYQKEQQNYKKDGDVNLIGDAGFSISIIPVFEVSLFRLPVVEMGVSPGISLDWKFNQPLALWHSQYNYGGEIYAKLNNSHFKFLNGDLGFAYDLPSATIYTAPTEIKLISGDKQEAIQKQPLKNPIVFEVLDSDNEGQGPVKVFYSSNYGKWGNETVLSTPLTGRVSNTFIIGDTDKEHILKATIKDADEKVIKEVVLTFDPKLDTAALLVTHGTWRAYEGHEEDGMVFGKADDFTQTIDCGATITQTIRLDSLNFSFRKDGSGTLSLLEYWRNPKIGDNCKVEYSIEHDWDHTSFTWEYVAKTGIIRIVFPIEFYEKPAGIPVDFKIHSFSKDQMIIETDADPTEPMNFYFKFK